MAHYAFIDDSNTVVEVIVGNNESDTSQNWETFYGNIKGLTCKRTSYNTTANTHNQGGTPYRGNYAGVGYVYDPEQDIFYPPKPYPSWSLDLATCLWAAPVAYPSDNNLYTWDEDNQAWVAV